MLSTICNRIGCNWDKLNVAGQIFYNDMANENICTMNGDKKYFLGFLELKFHIWVNPP